LIVADVAIKRGRGDTDSRKKVRVEEAGMRNIEKYFTESEIEDLLRRTKRRASRGSIVDKVDHALVVFAYATGCRVGEIASTTLEKSEPNHLDLRSGTLTITQAKYGSAGNVPIDIASMRILRWYVRDVRPTLKNASVLRHLFLTKTGRPYSANILTQKLSLLLVSPITSNCASNDRIKLGH
jgi:site-specific recombinase XerD